MQPVLPGVRSSLASAKRWSDAWERGSPACASIQMRRLRRQMMGSRRMPSRSAITWFWVAAFISRTLRSGAESSLMSWFMSSSSGGPICPDGDSLRATMPPNYTRIGSLQPYGRVLRTDQHPARNELRGRASKPLRHMARLRASHRDLLVRTPSFEVGNVTQTLHKVCDRGRTTASHPPE